MTGKLYGVGIGPGDPELITLKAVRIIEECDVVAFPQTNGENTAALDIASQTVKSLSEKEILPLDMPMLRDKVKAEQSRDSIAKILMEKLDMGKNVAFLTLGDPCVYSTYLYAHERVLNKGYSAQIISGVPSFCAVSAALNAGLVEGDEALIVIPASYDGSEDLLGIHGTKVLMKTGKSVSKVKAQLRESKLYDNAKMVENCGHIDEKIYNSMDDVDDNAHYFSVIIAK